MNTIWQERYQEPTVKMWKGREDGPNAKRFHDMIKCLTLDDNLQPASTNAIALLGFACDEGVKRNQGRSGAYEGPSVFRQFLSNLPWHNSANNLLYDVGDIFCKDGNLEFSQDALAQVVSILHQKKIRTALIGGGHELAWGHFQGLPDASCAIVNFDSHFDLRPQNKEKGTSGTSFLQISEHCKTKGKDFHYTCFGIQKTGNTSALFEQAEELGVRYMEAEEFHQNSLEKAIGIINTIITKHDVIYVSLCLDVFAAPFAPGVSAPQPLGIFPYHAIPLLERLASSGKVIAFDIAELSPSCDSQGVTARLSAQLFSTFFNLWSTTKS